MSHAKHLRDLTTSELTDKFAELCDKIERLERGEMGYRVLYNRMREVVAALEHKLNSPPDESVTAALLTFWRASGPWFDGDKERMRLALRAGFAAIAAEVTTVRLHRGIRDFTAAEVEAGCNVIRSISRPGSKLHAHAEKVVRMILKAVAKTKS